LEVFGGAITSNHIFLSLLLDKALLVSVPEAAKMPGIGRMLLYEQINAGKFPP
jgi:hypothetical protein